ncbi:unnamed protein product, partial [marine sediment metagenome]
TQDDIDLGHKDNTAAVKVQTPENTVITASDEHSEPLPQNAGIKLIKEGQFQDTDGIAEEGEMIDYTFTVTNTGNVTLDSVMLTDNMVTGLTQDVDDVVGNNDSLLEVGEVWGYTGSYTITQADINAGQKENTATVTADDPFDTEVSGEGDATVILRGIILEKTGEYQEDGDGAVEGGETISYTFNVTNTTKVSLVNVEVTDDDPLINPIFDSGDTNMDDILDPGETWVYTGSYAITQEDIDAGEKENTATVTVEGPGGDTVSASDSHITVILSADIGDFVWFDFNGNGVQEFGESGVEGVTVELFS